MPRSWNQLPKSEQQKIVNVFEDYVDQQMVIVIDALLKMVCSSLHDGFGFGEERLTQHLEDICATCEKHSKFVKEGTQSEVLDEEMRKIFRRRGYPDKFFRSMIDGWNIDTNKKGCG